MRRFTMGCVLAASLGCGSSEGAGESSRVEEIAGEPTESASTVANNAGEQQTSNDAGERQASADASDAGNVLPDSGDAAGTCRPGEEAACAAGFGTGVRRCRQDGSGYEECQVRACIENYLLENGRCRPCQYVAEYAHPARTCTNGVDTCTTPARPNTSAPLAAAPESAKTDGCSLGYWSGSSVARRCSTPTARGGLTTSAIHRVMVEGGNLAISGVRQGWGTTNESGILTLGGGVEVSGGGGTCGQVVAASVSGSDLEFECETPTWGGVTRSTLRIHFERTTLTSSARRVGGAGITSITGSSNTLTIAGYAQSWGGVQQGSLTITLAPECWDETTVSCVNNPVNGVCPLSLEKGTFDFASGKVSGAHEDALLCYPANELRSVCK